MKNIGIIGCGWLGSRIAKTLTEKYTVYVTTTSSHKLQHLNEQGFNPSLMNFGKDDVSEDNTQWAVVKHLDTIIITVPFSGKYEHSDELEDKVNRLYSFIGNFQGQMFLMSSTGVYPDIEKEFSENDLSPENVLGEHLVRSKFPQVNILRLAGLMGDDRFLSKYKVSNLQSPVNHIHYADVSLIIKKMIERKSSAKLYNVAAPLHPTKAEVIHNQKGTQYPHESRGNGRIISSQRLISDLDFVFTYPDPKFFHQ